MNIKTNKICAQAIGTLPKTTALKNINYIIDDPNFNYQKFIKQYLCIKAGQNFIKDGQLKCA